MAMDGAAPVGTCTFSSPWYTAAPDVAYAFGGDIVTSAYFGLSGTFYDATGGPCSDLYPTVYPVVSVAATTAACSPVSSIATAGYTLLCYLPQASIPPNDALSVYNFVDQDDYNRYAPFYIPITATPDTYTGDPTVTSYVDTDATVTGDPTPGITETTTIYDAATNIETITVTPDPTTTTEFSEIACSGTTSPSYSNASVPVVDCSVSAYTAYPSYTTTNLSIGFGGTGKPIIPVPSRGAFLITVPGDGSLVIVTRTTTIQVQRTSCPANCQAPAPTLAPRVEQDPNSYYTYLYEAEGSDSTVTTFTFAGPEYTFTTTTTTVTTETSTPTIDGTTDDGLTTTSTIYAGSATYSDETTTTLTLSAITITSTTYASDCPSPVDNPSSTTSTDENFLSTTDTAAFTNSDSFTDTASSTTTDDFSVAPTDSDSFIDTGIPTTTTTTTTITEDLSVAPSDTVSSTTSAASSTTSCSSRRPDTTNQCGQNVPGSDGDNYYSFDVYCNTAFTAASNVYAVITASCFDDCLTQCGNDNNCTWMQFDSTNNNCFRYASTDSETTTPNSIADIGIRPDYDNTRKARQIIN